jgi:hypothetical protein
MPQYLSSIADVSFVTTAQSGKLLEKIVFFRGRNCDYDAIAAFDRATHVFALRNREACGCGLGRSVIFLFQRS